MLLSVCVLISDVMDVMDSVSSRYFRDGTDDGNPARTASGEVAPIDVDVEMLDREELEDCLNIL
jgi:hypothetical protein